MLRILLSGYWLCVNLVTAILLIAYVTRMRQFLLFRELSEYGKLRRSSSSGNDSQTSNSLLRLLRVPKRWFRHFYACGIFYGLAVLGVKLYSGYGSIDGWTRLVALLMLLFQVIRRCMETCFISVFSNSTMHVGHYMLGLTFYLFTTLTIGFEPLQNVQEMSQVSVASFFQEFCWYQYGGVVLFAWVNYHQHLSACILAGLRKSCGDREKYAIPHGDWFDFVSFPHYLQEILIYTALYLVVGTGSWILFLQLSFVFLNQTLCALQSQHWYMTVMGCSPAKYCIIPLIL